MSTEPITLAGNAYYIGKLSPMEQFHVARRIAPLIAKFGLTAKMVQQAEGANLGDFIEPIAEELAHMREEDVDYVLFKCLAACKRMSAGRPAPLIASGNRMLFEDIDMPTMIRLTVEVIRENMASFFAAVPGLTSSAGG